MKDSRASGETPAHHYPAVQGLHQVNVSPEGWESFFSVCWDAYEDLMKSRGVDQTEAPPLRIVKTSKP